MVRAAIGKANPCRVSCSVSPPFPPVQLNRRFQGRLRSRKPACFPSQSGESLHSSQRSKTLARPNALPPVLYLAPFFAIFAVVQIARGPRGFFLAARERKDRKDSTEFLVPFFFCAAISENRAFLGRFSDHGLHGWTRIREGFVVSFLSALSV